MPKDFDLTRSVTVATEPLKEPIDPYSLRKWWHQVLHDQGRYSCYAILIVLPSDTEARRYARVFGRELDLISGTNCLVIALSKKRFKRFGFDRWGQIVDEEVPQGYSITVAKLFGIDFTQFPCLVVFEDICSPDHIVITLKGMTAEEIAETMRSLFSIIQKAISEKKSPLAVIESKRNKESFRKAGQTIVSKLNSLAGKTFEIAMKAFINAVIK